MPPFIEVPEVPSRFSHITAKATPRPWYSIKNTADDEAELLIYDEIGGWFGSTAEQFLSDLKAVTAPRLRVRVNSPGGSVFEGVAIANALRAHAAEVTVQIDGIAASIASVIAIAGDRVVAQPQSMLMIHDASGACVGDAADMASMAEVLNKLSDNIAGAYAAKAGGDVATWRESMQAETWYTADEAVAAGLVDEVNKAAPAEPEPDARLRATWDLSVFKHAPVDTATPTHHTTTTDHPWDAGAHEKRLPSPMPVATAKKFYAWYDADQVDNGELPKSAGKLPHHEVSADGTPGMANMAGVRNALSRLPQSDVPAGERAAVEAHLRAHLDDGREPDNITTAGLIEAFIRTLDRIEAKLATTPEPEVVPADLWTEATAHLVAVPADPWAANVAHLTNPNLEPSSAATAA